MRSVDEIPSFVIKPVNWPSTTPTTDNKAGSAREGLISPSIVRLEELELAGRLMLYKQRCLDQCALKNSSVAADVHIYISLPVD